MEPTRDSEMGGSMILGVLVHGNDEQSRWSSFVLYCFHCGPTVGGGHSVSPAWSRLGFPSFYRYRQLRMFVSTLSRARRGSAGPHDMDQLVIRAAVHVTRTSNDLATISSRTASPLRPAGMAAMDTNLTQHSTAQHRHEQTCGCPCAKKLQVRLCTVAFSDTSNRSVSPGFLLAATRVVSSSERTFY